MRQSDGGMPWSTTMRLMAAAVVVFAAECIDDAYLHVGLARWLAFTGSGLAHGYVWQLVTYPLVHSGLISLAFELLNFYWLGRFAEQVMGAGRMVAAMTLFGAVGALAQAAWEWLMPISVGPVFMTGASAGLCGLLAIFGSLQAEAEVSLFGVLPFQAKMLVWLVAGLSAFFLFVPAWQGVPHAANLAGIGAGLLWVRLRWHEDYVETPWRQVGGLAASLFRRRQRRAVRLDTSGWEATRVRSRADAVADADADEREVDRILEKIGAHGIHSITERERRVLEAAAKARAGRR